MKINNNYTNIYNISNNNFPKYDSKQTAGIKQNNSVPFSYPKNYYIPSFGTRTIMETYNEFNDSEMPSTVKNHIEEIITSPFITEQERANILSAENLRDIHQEAFSDLPNCHSAADIKRTYPFEKCFNELTETFEKDSFLNALQGEIEAHPENFNGDTDVQTYLIKKVLYDGLSFKDIQEHLFDTAQTTELQEQCIRDKALKSETFTKFGVKLPFTHTYGKTLKAGSEEFRARLKKLSNQTKELHRWEKMTPEEAVEEIKKLLKGNDDDTNKNRISMIQAWNKLFDDGSKIRESLSDFLYVNINNPQYDFDYDIDSIYTGNFAAKMSRIMTDFWKQFPDFKTELAIHIINARDEYDCKYEKGEPDFPNYVLDVYKRRDEIKSLMKQNLSSRKPIPNTIQKEEKIQAMMDTDWNSILGNAWNS